MRWHRFVAVLAALALSSGATSIWAQPAPDVVEFSLPPSVQPGQDVTFTVRAVNRGQSASTGSISISFPDQSRVSIVDSSPAVTSGSYAQVFQPGANVYNFSLNRAIPAQYPLAELYLMEPWPPGQDRFLTVSASPPAFGASLVVQARVTLRTAAGFFNYPPTGQPDQQGFPAQTRLVPVLAVALPPTSTPAPTRTPVPSPTRAPTQTPPSTATPTASATTTATATATPAVEVAGAAAGSTPGDQTFKSIAQPDSGSGGSAIAVLFGVLLAAGAIGVGAVALTRRPAARATAPYGRGPLPPSPYPPASPYPSNPPSPAPAPGSYPPRGPGQAAVPVPSGYQIVGSPKHGGMATVYKAFQPSLHRYVALKVLSQSLGSDPSFYERFQGEARWTARLEHPNIVPIYDMGQANGSTFIVMRFIDGLTLQELLNRESRLPIGRTIHIAAQVASALDYAHGQGFVHRDVKPANIMVEAGDRVTLTDFGIARVVGETRLTRTGSIVGTPEYLSPEQARGDQVDGRADLYALGVVVYELLAGRPPFQAENPLSVVHAHLMTAPPPPTQFNPAIPAAVAAVLLKVLAKDPGHRFPSGDAFVQALRQAAGGLG